MNHKIASFIIIIFLLSRGIAYAQADQLQGISQEELQIKAQELGISPEELKKYEQQFLRMRQSRSQQIQQSQPAAPRITPDTSVIVAPPPPKPMTSYRVKEFSNRPYAEDLPAFGYDVFTYSPSTFLPANNVPTPTNYVFGPGDEIIITLWGETQLTQDVVVSKNGDITVPDVGVINVNGLSLGALKVRLFERLSNVYSSLKSSKTHISVTTGELRSVKVYVLGEVKTPGGYVLPALSTSFTALYYAGGPTLNGSLRDVKVLRDGKVIADIDLYQYLIKGDQSGDVRLQDEDILFVPPVGKRVAVNGSVFRPAVYELKNGENLKDLLSYAGGLEFNAYFRTVHIERVIPFNQRKNYENNILSIDLNFNNVDELKNSTYTLDDGDVVDILSINEKPQNRVTITGDVRQPGVYELTGAGMTVRDLIFKADSLFPDAFLGKATLIRTLPSEKKEILSFNLAKALAGDPDNNYVLKNRDEVRIYNQNAFFPMRTVDIAGQVVNPGTYSRFKNMTLTDLIVLAGGLTETASTKNIEITRLDTVNSNIFSHKYSFDLPEDYWDVNKSGDFKLEDFDRVLIKTDTAKTFGGTVTVEGEVNFPGTYTILYKGERLSDFVKRAGGLKSTAYTNGIYLKRSNPVINMLKKVSLPDSLKFRSLLNEPLFDRSVFDKEYGDMVPINWQSIVSSDSTSIYNLPLLPGDSLEIPKDNHTISVVGDVNLPSTVPYKKGAGVSYYIKQAGGYTTTSADGEEIVILPNGKKWETSGWFFIPNPEISSGSTIFVPSRIIEAPTNLWPYIRDIFTIVSSAAVLILTVHNLSK